VEGAIFFVAISAQCIVWLHKEITKVKSNTMVNDELKCRGVEVLRK
jgi:hypothetical protein